MERGDTLLEVRNLKVHFPVERGILVRRRVGWLRAVDDVSFSLSRGESVGLVGESGCGKTTTAMAIAMLQKPTAGSVYLEGRDLLAMKGPELTRERQNFQIVFQDPYSSLDPRMRAGDIVAEPLRIFARRGIIKLGEAEIQKQVDALLDRVGLSASFKGRYPHEFSGGQRQRIGIARALSLKPRLVIADEPVSALDVSIQSQILNLLKDLQKDFGLTYLFIAHNLAVVEYFCDRIIVMYLGTIAEISDSHSLYEEPLHPYTKALMSAVPIPDPPRERSRKRIILRGDVPSPLRERTGCPFADRCPEVLPHCASSVPPLVELSGGRRVACFLYADAPGAKAASPSPSAPTPAPAGTPAPADRQARGAAP